MVKFLVRRVLFLILTLWAVSIAIFAISEIAPGNIAINSLGNTITPQQEASFNAQNGLDQSVVTRYVRWMVYYAFVFVIIYMGVFYNRQFIYFQF